MVAEFLLAEVVSALNFLIVNSLDQPRLQALARGVISVHAVVQLPALWVAAYFYRLHSYLRILLFYVVQVIELRRLVGLQLL
jgi:hypothetical protein